MISPRARSASCNSDSSGPSSSSPARNVCWEEAISEPSTGIPDSPRDLAETGNSSSVFRSFTSELTPGEVALTEADVAASCQQLLVHVPLPPSKRCLWGEDPVPSHLLERRRRLQRASLEGDDGIAPMAPLTVDLWRLRKPHRGRALKVGAGGKTVKPAGLCFMQAWESLRRIAARNVRHVQAAVHDIFLPHPCDQQQQQQPRRLAGGFGC
mmetsp:Transcript_25883/g.74034  ORF Transcript_25883/g.74034 Transcript_25883/m.74034 type:complete len:211 (-) Transcript_25883:283-915(-)